MRKSYIIILALVVAICGFVVISFLLREKAIKTSFNGVATNLQQPELVNDSVYFFTGSSFARFNPPSAKTERISGYFSTDGQVAVNDYSKNGVVFSTSGTTAGDIFGQTLLNNGFSESQNSWWKYDFISQALQLIDFRGSSSCVEILQNQDSLFCFAPKNASQQTFMLVKYGINTKNVEELLQTDGAVSSVSISQNKIYYIRDNLDSTQSLYSYDLATKSNVNVHKGKGPIMYAAGKDGLVVIDMPNLSTIKVASREIKENSGKTTRSKVTIYYLSKDGAVLKKFGKKLSSGFLSSSNNYFVYSENNGYFYLITDKKIERHSSNKGSTGLIWDINNDYYYVDSNNELYSTKKIKNSLNGLDFKENLNGSPNRFYVSAATNDINKTYTNDSSKDFNGNALNVGSFLLSNGFDPNQFQFQWDSLMANPTVNNSIPVTVLN